MTSALSKEEEEEGKVVNPLEKEDDGNRVHNDSKRERKRKRKTDDSCLLAYKGVCLTPIAPTSSQPGSPSRFFSASFEGSFVGVSKEEENLTQVVHQHVNGLCVVTIGKQECAIQKIHWEVEEAEACSGGERRKRQKPKKNVVAKPGFVSPDTIIARLELENGKRVAVRSFVWGSVLEINRQCTPAVLQKDPLLDGYMAIISPTGDFPPPTAVPPFEKNNPECNQDDVNENHHMGSIEEPKDTQESNVLK